MFEHVVGAPTTPDHIFCPSRYFYGASVHKKPAARCEMTTIVPALQSVNVRLTRKVKPLTQSRTDSCRYPCVNLCGIRIQILIFHIIWEIKSKVYFILFYFSLRRAICFCQILAWMWLEYITPARPRKWGTKRPCASHGRADSF